jgi:hypothetical protein
MWRADFRRSEQSRRNVETHFLQIVCDGIESQSEVSGDIFEKHEFRLDVFNDSHNSRPYMPRVMFTTSQSGGAEWLAWVSRNDSMNNSAPRFAIECGNIGPNRRVIQFPLFHSRCQYCRRICFPFNVTHRANSSVCGNCQSKFQSADSGTQ